MKLCETCGRKPTKSATAAECWACYTRRRRADPVIAEQSRAISRAWKDGHREANRARDRQRHYDTKDACPQCGGAKTAEAERCDGCRHAVAGVRQSLVEGMWADGWLAREINEVLGLSPTSQYVCVMRARGWDLPHRYKMRDRKRVAV